MPEIPENVGALTKLTEAATVDIISILASHNPRLRPRFDRIHFDANDVQVPRHSSCCGCWNQVTLVEDGLDSHGETTIAECQSCSCSFSASQRGTDVSALRRLSLDTSEEYTAHNTAQNSIKFGDHQTKRIVDGTGFERRSVEKPKRRMLDRLLGCLGSSRSSD